MINIDAITYKLGHIPGLYIKGDSIVDWPYNRELPTIEELAAWEIEYNKYQDNIAYREKRKVEYPELGTQLDAILKQLNYMQMSGQTNLIDELDGVVGDWLRVKRKYPKPEK